MTPFLRFMRQLANNHLTRDPYLIGSTRQCHTRTLTCDPYQIGSNPARHICHTRTLSHDPFIGAKHGVVYARDGARKTEGKQGTMGRLVTTGTILPRTNKGDELHHITNLQHQPSRTNLTNNATLDSIKAL